MKLGSLCWLLAPIEKCCVCWQVVNVYLFHELPGEVQKRAAKEMARVCKPGGMVILTDSTQLGDRPEWDATLGGFGNFNEPYYVNYIATDLGELFSCDMTLWSDCLMSKGRGGGGGGTGKVFSDEASPGGIMTRWHLL